MDQVKGACVIPGCTGTGIQHGVTNVACDRPACGFTATVDHWEAIASVSATKCVRYRTRMHELEGKLKTAIEILKADVFVFWEGPTLPRLGIFGLKSQAILTKKETGGPDFKILKVPVHRSDYELEDLIPNEEKIDDGKDLPIPNPLLERAKNYALNVEEGFGWDMGKHERKAWKALLTWGDAIHEILGNAFDTIGSRLTGIDERLEKLEQSIAQPKPFDSGDCSTCDHYLSGYSDGSCRTGNNTKANSCCYHTGLVK